MGTPAARMVIAVLAFASAVGGCAHVKDRDGDGDGGGRAPLLLKRGRRLPDAVIEHSPTGRRRNDVEALRERLCEEHDGEAVVFYQLVVSRHWHYYWLCNGRREKVATRRGVKMVARWLRRIRRRASAVSAGCAAGSSQRIFAENHESGTEAVAFCDGVLQLRYADRTKDVMQFRTQAGSTDAGRNTGATCPPCRCPTAGSCPPCPSRGQCPVCRPKPCNCPRCPRCKVCPVCPKPNTRATCLKYGKAAYFKAVKDACRVICPGIYKRCRKLNPKTSMCFQLQEWCQGLKGVCKR